MSSDVVWLAILALAAVIEGHAIFNKADGDTLSERTRDWFRTDTRGGKAGFVVVWIGFAVWFLVHIVTELV